MTLILPDFRRWLRQSYPLQSYLRAATMWLGDCCRYPRLHFPNQTASVMTELAELDIDTYDWLEQFDHYDPVLTCIGDPHGPIGNNSGADVIDYYRQWRHVGRSPKKFHSWIIREWEIDPGFQDLTNEKLLRAELKRNHFNILTWDDVVIAIVFSQFFVDGQMLKPSINLAINAINRQRLNVIMTFRGWSLPQERLDALNKMQIFIDENGG